MSKGKGEAESGPADPGVSTEKSGEAERKRAAAEDQRRDEAVKALSKRIADAQAEWTSASARMQERLDAQAKRIEVLESEKAALAERVERLERHLNLQAVLRPEQVVAALAENPRREFVVAAPSRAGSVVLTQGQVISSTSHNVEMLARAGIPLRHAA